MKLPFRKDINLVNLVKNSVTNKKNVKKFILSRAADRERKRKTLLPPMRKKNRLNCNSKMGPKINTFSYFSYKNTWKTYKNTCVRYQKSTNINQYQQISSNINKYQPISTNINKYQPISTNINKYLQI